MPAMAFTAASTSSSSSSEAWTAAAPAPPTSRSGGGWAGGNNRAGIGAPGSASALPAPTVGDGGMAAAGRAAQGGEEEEEDWVRAAESHFHAIAPPPSTASAAAAPSVAAGPSSAASGPSSVAAAEAHARGLGMEDAEWEAMLQAKADLDFRDALPANYVDPVPERHKERLRRALAKNMEYVLQKDADERRRALDGFDAATNDHRNPASYGGGGGGGKKRSGGGVFSRGPARTGGLGSAEAPRGPSHSGRGSGGAQQRGKTDPNAPNTAVYVTGLPASATWASVDLLFAPYGRVKRIKIYRSTDAAAVGAPKGDALVTFVKPGSVGAAVAKLHGAQQPGGSGAVLTVEPASFDHKAQEEEAAAAEEEEEAEARAREGGYEEGGGEYGDGFDEAAAAAGGGEAARAAAVAEAGFDGADLDAAGVPLYRPLPAECGAAALPTAVLRNLYTLGELSGGGPAFLEELEAEILVEAARFGNVQCVLTLPDQPYYFGAALVTFQDVSAAQACGEVMDGRSFAEGFIQVQALGNWGEGEIVPASPPGASGTAVVAAAEEAKEEGAASAATAGGDATAEEEEEEEDEEGPDLDGFFSDLQASEEGAPDGTTAAATSPPADLTEKEAATAREATAPKWLVAESST